MKPFSAEGAVTWSRERLARKTSLIAKVLYLTAALPGVIFAVLLTVDSDLAEVVYGRYALLLSTYAIYAAFLGLMIATVVLSTTRSLAPGSVEVTDDALVVSQGKSVRRFDARAVVSAYVVARPGLGSWTVEIEIAGGDVAAVRMPDRESADALVDALGFGPDGKRVTVRLATPSRRLLNLPVAFGAAFFCTVLTTAASVMFAMGALGSVSTFSGLLQPLLVLLVYRSAKRFVAGTAVTVGADGLWVDTGRRKKFISRDEIARVIRGPDNVALGIMLRDGTTIPMHGIAMDLDRRAAVSEVAHARLGTATESADRAPQFAREGRPVAEWRAHIARMMEDAGYRSVAHSSEQTSAVMKSPLAKPEERVGAAIAMRIAGEPPERIRIAAESAADPNVREALEAVADDAQPKRLERALRRLR